MELKAEQWLDYSGEPMPCYPKAEAGRYIAELEEKHKMEVEQLIIEVKNLEKTVYELTENQKNLIIANMDMQRIIRHQKWKRCIYTARECYVSSELERQLGSDHYANWYMKWYYRWSKLADKFADKEA